MVDQIHIYRYVEENIADFHNRRIAALERLSLDKILLRKNPYLFRVKNLLTSEQIIKGVLEAYLSSMEETIFGDWLEGLALFVNNLAYGGRKSSTQGIDLEFDREGVRYIVAIKSGPNWGNSSQIRKMIDDFKKAIRTLRTSNSNLQVIAVNGCCYGKERNSYKDGYYKYCGDKFWEFISGNPNLYLDIIEPLGHMARTRNEEFNESYSALLNKLTLDFSSRFCDESGRINWNNIVRFNSENS